ncbi:MAG: aminotransferase class I/II-fold pyridoxal phosphate-dependent enzyme [Nitrososphaerales archaeon]
MIYHLRGDEFRVTVEQLEKLITPRTKMIILNSPHNPCGSCLTLEDLKGIAEIASKHNLLVLSDEIYYKIIYDEEHGSMASLPEMMERTIIINGFSKTYAMTGWRLGYAIAKKWITDKLVKLQINMNSCPTALAQIAAIQALKGPQEHVKEMVGEYRRRRDLMVEGLNRIDGVSCLKPSGAFYAFPNVKSFRIKSKSLMQYLLVKAGLAVLHGDAFGSYGEGYLRLS